MRFSHPPPLQSPQRLLRRRLFYVGTLIWAAVIAATLVLAFRRSRLTLVCMIGGWLLAVAYRAGVFHTWPKRRRTGRRRPRNKT